MIMAKKTKTPKTKSGGIKITLTHDFIYPNGMKLKAGKTYTVTHDFYKELNDGGFLTEKKTEK